MKESTGDQSVRRISEQEWRKIGIDKFGADTSNWKFKCVRCGGVQTLSEFKALNVEEPEGKVFYSCIGRWDKNRGCDWTLGGLLRIHKLEIIVEYVNVTVPVFEFADI